MLLLCHLTYDIGMAQNEIPSLYSIVDSIERITHIPNPGNSSLPRLQTISGQRYFHFLHGLGGSSKSWNRTAQHYLLNYDINVTWSDYSHLQNGTLLTPFSELDYNLSIANSINSNSVNWDTVPRENHIIFAHSQGGLVAKAMDYMYNTYTWAHREFGGIVTFGTPHKGAQILNNVDPSNPNNLLDPFLSDGCQVLSKAEIANALGNTALVFGFIDLTKLINLDSLSSNICQGVAPKFIRALASQFDDPITHDYQVGSSMIATLNQHSTNTPIITFYGEEEDPVFWRLISSLSLHGDSLIQDPFNATNDQQMVNAANQLMSHYHSKFLHHKEMEKWHRRRATRNYWASLYLLNPTTLIIAASAETNANFHGRRKKWNEDAFNWFHSANEKWEHIIGATKDSLMLAPAGCRCGYFTSSGSAFGSNPIFWDYNPFQSSSLNECDDDVQTITLLETCDPPQHGICNCHYYYSYQFPQGTAVASSTRPANECVYGGGYNTHSFFRRCTQYNSAQIVRFIHPNDGVVLAESALGHPNKVAYDKMQNTNHQQMRNCDETERVMRQLLTNGPDKYLNTDYFTTPTR